MNISSGIYLINWHSPLVQNQFISTITTFSKFMLPFTFTHAIAKKKKKRGFTTVEALQG